MPTIEESLGHQSQLNAALVEGVNSLSQDQTIVFTLYTRQVLPLDGFIFWFKTDRTFTASGSLHYSVDTNQREDETISVNHVVFTANEQVEDLNVIAPQTMWIGTFGELRFSFSSQANFYEQAGLWHYRGDAIYPAMESQIVDSAANLDLANVVTSNSLPIWLTLNALMPVYPSFLIPDNIVPPYAAVHIDPAGTSAIQSAPHFTSTLTHMQLVRDKVKITIYGSRNTNALDYQDYIFNHSLNTDDIGIMNMPVIRDEKRTQNEISVVAMKKSIEFDVSYYQTRINTASRQFILQSIQTYLINPL